MSKPSLSKQDTVSFFLKSPTGKRKTFSIVKRVTRYNQKTEYDTINTPQTKTINKLLLECKKTQQAARLEFKEIIKNLLSNELKRRGDSIVSEENHIVLQEYLNKKYPDLI